MNEDDAIMGYTPASWRRLALYWRYRHGGLPPPDFMGGERMIDFWNANWPHPVCSDLVSDGAIVNLPRPAPPSAEIDFWVIRFWNYVAAQCAAFPPGWRPA